ncbi:hypothetical protein KTD31_00015 [Burkholderia multivorans]|uniref:hypothetical protein n=1 Tax=Burkholderia multivorans TaxID=87883 RepID=UPI001C24C39C|nr:hypothetical protein [Burkholderia multivorans]MBU9199782.1 hypothetical protein [Burkholderia multivorans]MDN8079099.1 hypothetical protein [Burkholderia multivorans]
MAAQPSSEPTLTSLEEYLGGRKDLIAGRETLFAATRMYLRPGQRPDARQLGDELWNSPAREISDEEWVANAARGYVTVLGNESKGRHFRLCVLQQGFELRVGVRVPAEAIPSRAPDSRLLTVFGDHPPILTALDNHTMLVDWHFSAKYLYTQAQAMEDAVYRIGAVFEAALQSKIKPGTQK